MRAIVLFFFIFFSFSYSFGQIQFNESPEVKSLLTTWEQAAFSNPYISGWRVQIASTNDLRKADEMKQKFSEQYPDIPVEWIQEYPYYKVRIGAFLEKRETKTLIHTVSSYYPGTYAAKDEKIPVSDFISN